MQAKKFVPGVIAMLLLYRQFRLFVLKTGENKNPSVHDLKDYPRREFTFHSGVHKLRGRVRDLKKTSGFKDKYSFRLIVTWGGLRLTCKVSNYVSEKGGSIILEKKEEI